MADDVFSFWASGTLGPLQHACIASWLRMGHRVSLYSFDRLKNVPHGVLRRDANDILPADYMKRLTPLRRDDRPWQEIVSYSDLFRMKAMLENTGQKNRGLWLDTDMYLLKPALYERNKLHLAWEGTRKIGVSALYIPPDSPILQAYLSVLDRPDLMPDWLGFRRLYLKTLHWRCQGKAFRATDISITAYGNLAIRQLVFRYGMEHQILPKTTYYHWTGNRTGAFYTDPGGRDVLDSVNATGIHVHRKVPANDAPVPFTLYDRALR